MRSFGSTNFRSEIVWKRTSAHSASHRWNDVHDTLLFYAKSNSHTWNEVLLEHSDEYAARYKNVDAKGDRWSDDNLTGPGIRHGDSGAVWRGYDPTAKGSHWKISNKAVEAAIGAEKAASLTTTQKLDALDEAGMIHWPKKHVRGSAAGFPRFKRYLMTGAPVQDVITDIPPINSQAQERLGYPTQKPVAPSRAHHQREQQSGRRGARSVLRMRHHDSRGAETRPQMDRHRCHLSRHQSDQAPAARRLRRRNRVRRKGTTHRSWRRAPAGR